MAKDLQEFLTALDKKRPDQVLRIQPTIDTQQHEVAALLKVLEDRQAEQVVVFENPTSVHGRKSIPLMSNLFCSRGLCAMALDLPYEQHGMALVDAFVERERCGGQLQAMSSPPCQQIIRRDAEADLWDLPIPRNHRLDVGPYLTMTCVMKGRGKDFYDITFTKNWVKEPQRMSVSAHGHHHLAKIIAAHETENRPTPMIVILGHHPSFMLSACCLMPYGNNDYLTAAAFLQEPLRLAPSITWGEDFLVPADADIVIEAEVLPGVRETQNPFGEIAGYYQPAMQSPVARVRALTMKKDAVMQSVFAGHAEHWHLGGIPKEGSLFGNLRKKFPNVSAVHLPPWGCGRFGCVIAMKKEQPSDPRRAAMLAFPEIEHLKMVIVVDEDVDVYDQREVHWAVVTRTHWDKDVEILKNVQSFRPWMGEAVTIIDATRPSGVAFPLKNEVPPEAIRAVIEKGFL